jgi:hypothetical protein
VKDISDPETVDGERKRRDQPYGCELKEACEPNTCVRRSLHCVPQRGLHSGQDKGIAAPRELLELAAKERLNNCRTRA